MTSGAPGHVGIPYRRRLEPWLVLGVCAHSLAVGVLLMAAPGWAAHFGGWHVVEPVFFVRQAGIFHVVLVLGYAIEYVRTRGVLLMICAKCTAVVFLLAAAVLDDVPWAVPVSAAGDATMALLVWWVHRRVVADRHREVAD